MLVLGAPKELEALVGLFGKLYTSTLDCVDVYDQRSTQEKTADEKVHEPHPQPEGKISVFKYFAHIEALCYRPPVVFLCPVLSQHSTQSKGRHKSEAKECRINTCANHAPGNWSGGSIKVLNDLGE